MERKADKDRRKYTAQEIEAEIASFARKICGKTEACEGGEVGVIVASFRYDRKEKKVEARGGIGGNREAIAAMVATIIMGNPDISAQALYIVNSPERKPYGPSGSKAGKKAGSEAAGGSAG